MSKTSINELNMNKLSVKQLSDSQLLEEIGRQNKQALSELYDRYKHSLGAFLMRKLNQQKLVDEVYNDVMYTIWDKATTFRGDSKVSTWIFGIAYRQCLSHYRKESKHSDRLEYAELDDLPQKDETNADENLHIALASLNEKHRTVIDLAYYYGHSVTEISDIIDCPVNTVKTRLFHARQYLKEKLQHQSTHDSYCSL